MRQRTRRRAKAHNRQMAEGPFHEGATRRELGEQRREMICISYEVRFMSITENGFQVRK